MEFINTIDERERFIKVIAYDSGKNCKLVGECKTNDLLLVNAQRYLGVEEEKKLLEHINSQFETRIYEIEEFERVEEEIVDDLGVDDMINARLIK